MLGGGVWSPGLFRGGWEMCGLVNYEYKRAESMLRILPYMSQLSALSSILLSPQLISV